MTTPFQPFDQFIQSNPLSHHSSRVINSWQNKPRYKGSVFPTIMTFGMQTLNSQSAMQTGVVTNVGTFPLPIKAITGVGDWIVTNNCPAVLQPGQSCQISAVFNPSRAGLVTGGIYVDTGDSGGTEFIQLSGVGSGIAAPPAASALSISDGTISALGSAILAAFPAGTTALTSYEFLDTVTVGQLATVTFRVIATGNVTYTALPTSVGAFAIAYGEAGSPITAPASLTDGQTLRVTVTFSPTMAGAANSNLTLVSNSGSNVIALTGTGVASSNTAPTITGIPPGTQDVTVGVAATLANFTINDTVGETLTVTFTTNNGTINGLVDADGALAGLQLTGTASVINAAIADATFTATAPGTANIGISVSDGVNSAVTAGYTFNALPVGALQRITISGNQFYRGASTFRLKSVNWFGAETPTMVPHGMWIRAWRPMIAQMASMGFNCIRLPFSRQGFANLLTVPTDTGALGVGQGPGATDLNPDLAGLTVYEIFDEIIEECRLNNMYVVLDHHRNNWDAQDNTPVNATYNEAGWLALWGQMATRYGNNTTVIGADLYNEPSLVPWATLAPLYETCGNHIHTIAPDWLIFCEGGQAESGNAYWSGGNLEGVATRPVVLTIPNRVVYAPHEYGQSVYLQNWLSHGANVPVNWPNNLYPIRTFHWGFIFEQNIAPVWVGEFGGQFGYGNDGLEYPADYLVVEREWLTTMITYMNGDFDGNGSSSLTGSQKGISFAYWSYNVNSGDTGGLLLTDWITPQTGKLTLLAPLLSA